MSAIARVLVGAFALVGVAYVALMLFFFSGGTAQNPVCLTYPVMEVASPDGAYRATVENSSCKGGELWTSVDLLQVTSAGVGKEFERIFESPSASRSDAGSYSPLQLRLTWLSATELQIRYPRGTKVSSRTEIAGGVRVAYVETDAFAP